MPLVPEIRLHIAEESLPIWQKTEEELGEMNVPPPYWAFAWAGGQALARYLLDNPALVAGRRVLDLGSGSGLVAIAAAKAGAARVLAADIDALALAAIGLNAAANARDAGHHRRRSARRSLRAPSMSCWSATCSTSGRWPSACWPSPTPPSPGGAMVLAGDPRRSYFPPDRFRQLAEYSVPVTRELEDAEIKRTAVWRLDADRRQA